MLTGTKLIQSMPQSGVDYLKSKDCSSKSLAVSFQDLNDSDNELIEYLNELKESFSALSRNLKSDSLLVDPVREILSELDQALDHSSSLVDFREGLYTGSESLVSAAMESCEAALKQSLSRVEEISQNLTIVKPQLTHRIDPFCPSITNCGNKPGEFTKGNLLMTFVPSEDKRGSLVIERAYRFEGKKRIGINLNKEAVQKTSSEAAEAEVRCLFMDEHQRQTDTHIMGLTQSTEDPTVFSVTADQSYGLSQQLQSTDSSHGSRNIIKKVNEANLAAYASQFTYMVSSDVDRLINQFPGNLQDNIKTLRFGDCSTLSDHLAYHLQARCPCGAIGGYAIKENGDVYSSPGHRVFIYEDNGVIKEFDATRYCKKAYINLSLREEDIAKLENYTRQAQDLSRRSDSIDRNTQEPMLIAFREELATILRDPYYDQFEAKDQELTRVSRLADLSSENFFSEGESIEDFKSFNKIARREGVKRNRAIEEKSRIEGWESFFSKEGSINSVLISLCGEDFHHNSLLESFFNLGLLEKQYSGRDIKSILTEGVGRDDQCLILYGAYLSHHGLEHTASFSGFKSFIKEMVQSFSVAAKIHEKSSEGKAEENLGQYLTNLLREIWGLETDKIQEKFTTLMHSPVRSLIVLFARPPLTSLEQVKTRIDNGAQEFAANIYLPLASHTKQRRANQLRKSRFPSTERDFDHIREYKPGDDSRTINHKASARSRTTVVNTYQYHEPNSRSQDLDLVINFSPREEDFSRNYGILFKHDIQNLISFLVQNSRMHSLKSCSFYFGPIRLGELSPVLLKSLRTPKQARALTEKIIDLYNSQDFFMAEDRKPTWINKPYLSYAMGQGLPITNLINNSLREQRDLVIVNHGIPSLDISPNGVNNQHDEEKYILNRAGLNPTQFGFF